MFWYLCDKPADNFSLVILLIWYNIPSQNALQENYRIKECGTNCSYGHKNYLSKQSRKSNCHYKFTHAMKIVRLISDKRQPAAIREQGLLKPP